MKILLIEDEPKMAQAVGRSIEHEGFVVDLVSSVAAARAALSVARYALVLLDRRLPDGEGLELVGFIRASQPGTPVIVVSALDAVPDRIRGLDVGADDYLAKPFDHDELLARMRAALRRPGASPRPVIRCGELSFSPESREVIIGGEAVILGRRELAVLETLISRSGRVVQRATLLNEVYGFDDDVQSNTLDAHVSRLRARLSALHARVAIHPVRGVGYLLDEAAS